jgi:subtilisin family serine protease
MWPSIDEVNESLATGEGRGVTVAILDTGIDESHPALSETRFEPPQASRMTPQGSRVTNCDSKDLFGHGTAIAGIVHALAPRARLLSIRVLDCEKRQQRHEVIRAGARRAIALGAHILNCSFGIPGVPVTLPVYKDWTDLAFTSGRHVVAASSNSDPDEPHWPASFAQVLSVTSAELPPEVLRHRPGRLVSFEASGVKVPVLTPGGGTSTLTGSSFAAAHLTGLLARLLSHHPDLSPAFAQEALRGVAANEHPLGTQPSD